MTCGRLRLVELPRGLALREMRFELVKRTF
jgi:hypothetical protein